MTHKQGLGKGWSPSAGASERPASLRPRQLTIALTQTVESGAPFLHSATLHRCKKGAPLSTAGYAWR